MWFVWVRWEEMILFKYVCGGGGLVADGVEEKRS